MNPWLLSRSRFGRSVLEEQTDERLAELVAQGSDTAFELIVIRHRRSLIAHCARIVGDGDAEEAAQDALVKAHAALARGDQVRNVRAWLRAVAHNSAVNLVRDRATRPGPANGDDRTSALLHDDQVEQREELREVVAAVQALPERQRDALVMRELEGRSYEEIASRLGASRGAVRQLLNRARSALRDRLGLFIGPESLIRFVSSGTVASAIRVGAVSGGCALTIKVCATLLPAAVAAHHPPLAVAAHQHDYQRHRARPTTSVRSRYARATKRGDVAESGRIRGAARASDRGGRMPHESGARGWGPRHPAPARPLRVPRGRGDGGPHRRLWRR